MLQFFPKRFSLLPRHRAARRTLLGAAVFLLAFSLSGYVILPAVLKSQAERLVADKLQRTLTIGEVDVNPFALTLAVRNARLTEPQGDAVFASFDALNVNLSLQSVLRLAPVVQELRLTKPYVHLARTDAHRYNIDDILALVAAQPASDNPARFSINNIQVEGGSIRFEDRPAKTTHAIDDLRLGVPFISSLPSQVQIFVEPLISAKVNGTPLQLKGKARPFAEPRDARMELDLDDLDATRALEYLPFKPRFRMPSARLNLHLAASFVQPKDRAPSVTLNGVAAIKSLRITEPGGRPILSLPELAVTLRDTDVFGSRIEIARLFLDRPEADLVRGPDGQLNLAALLPATATATATAAQAGSAPAASAAPDIALGELEIRGAALRYADDHAARPLRAGVEKFGLTARAVTVDTRKRTVSIGAAGSDSASFVLNQGASEARAAAPPVAQEPDKGDAPYVVNVGRVAVSNWAARIEDRSQAEPVVTTVAPLSLSLHDLSTAPGATGRLELAATVNKNGRVALNGSLGLAPLLADLALDVKDVDILPLQPYVADTTNLQLSRASLSGNGRLQLAAGGDGALKGGFRGDLALGNVATVDKVNGKDFLRWKSLSLGGVDARFEPFALAVDQVTLSDFFARVIIDPAGRINLQDIARSHAGDRKSLTDASAPARAAPPLPAQAAAKAPAGAKDGAAAPVSIRKLTLQGGRVRFTDNFIKPNYSASLADFGGVVTNLSSEASSSASMDLHAEVNGAPLSVTGRINPLRGNLYMDVKAKVRGMELAPLSAYSGRYVGYGIEKGKLSFEVAYLVENRRLTAENRLILDQITFGDRIDSPGVTTLPVQFAVALLRDRNGVIDINLPIGGSLDDPEFSVGGILWKAIGNLIAKAVTQPFAVLGSLFGGGSAELSALAFEPGRFAIPAAGEDTLRSLARALAERPALTLDIAGRIDPQADRAGLARVSVERKVRAVKVKDLAARGESVAPGSVVVRAEEYPALLARAYREEQFDKPRNVLGLSKALPVAEMEQLMAANAGIDDDDDLIALGNQRAQAVKNWLVKNGLVPPERMFILAPKLGGEDAKGGAAASSRVDFSLR